MTSLDEHDKQLLETLLNQADAVAPTTDKTHQSERGGEIDFHSADHDDNDFKFLEHYITSDMGEGEAMQFEQQASSSGYAGQETSQQYQRTSDNHQSAPSASSYQGQGSSGYGGQHTRFSGVAQVQSPVQMEQSTPSPYQGQGHSYQQIQSPSVQSPQMNMTSPEGFQNPNTGFQQQYSSGAASAQGGQLAEAGSVSSGYPNQSQTYPQQYSMETSSTPQGDLSGHVGSTYQAQGVAYRAQGQQSSDSQAQQQQFGQHESGYTNSSSKEQVNLSGVYHNQSTDYQHQQQFQNEYPANSSTNSPSLQAIGQAAGFQQQFSGGPGSKPAAEQTELNQQQAMPVAGYQQQQQQQAVFHQGNQAAGNSADQSYQTSGSEGAAMCYTGELTGYAQQTGQQHQAAVPTNTGVGVGSPGGAEAGSGVHHPQAQYPDSAPAIPQRDQASAGTYPNQVNVFQKQQPFSSPAPSPGQPSQVVPASPAGYPQPSPQSAYSPPGQAQVQGDQCGGAGFAGQGTSFQPGQVSGFPQKIVFQTQSPVPSPGQAHVDNSVPSSPANNFQQPSPYPAQNSFPVQSPGSSLKQGDQNAGGNFSAPKAHHYSGSSAQSDGSVQSQGFTPPPMQESTGHSSMEAEAADFLQKFQSVHQQNKGLESGGTVGQYQQNPVSQASTQRDQPMETQQSPYLSGNASCGGVFASQSQAPPQHNVYQEAQAQMGQTSVSAASGYLDQTLAFQPQSSTFQTPSALPVPPLSSSISDIISAQGQNAAFAVSSKFDGGYHNPASAVFGQSVYSSGQTTNTSFSMTSCTPSIAVDQPESGTVTNQYNQCDSGTSSFKQFPSSAAPSFGQNSGVKPFQQYQQPLQQQPVQQAAYTSQSQDSSLVQNANAHTSVTDSQNQIFQAGSLSSQPTPGVQASAADQKFGIGNYQSQPAGNSVGQQLGLHNLLGHTSIVNVAHSSTSQTRAPFVHSAVSQAQGSNMPSTFSVPNINMVRSPTASLQDSNQTNSALTLLSSVLQQIQAILPMAVGQEQNSANNLKATAGQVLGGDPETLAKLLNSQNSAQQVLNLLQHQQAGSQKPQDQGQQNQGQGFQFTPEQQQADSSATQHPNFLLQQGNGLPLVLNQQQPSQQVQPQQHTQHSAESQVPVATVTSLPGSLNIAGGDGRQFVLGQQPIKVVLDANSAPLIVSGGFNVPSSMVIAQSSAGVAGLASLNSVSLSNQAVLSQPGIQAAPGGMRLPVDLQNVNLQIFSSSGAPQLSGMTHTISTTPTTAPNIGSTFSKNTFVTPTSSFTQPLPVAGVGLGVGTSTVNQDAPSDPTAFPAPSANPDLAVCKAENAAISGSGVGNSPAVANIFFPVSTESCLEKALAAPVSSLPASAQAGNFLNVTTGSASMLLNAMSMAAADGKRDSAGFKVNCFTGQSGTPEGLVGEIQRRQNAGKVDASDMDVSEPVTEIPRGVKPMDTDKPLENLTPRHSSRKTSMEEEFDQRGDALANSMLRKILTMKDEDDNAPRSKAGTPTPETSPIQTPEELCVDTNTQSTLIEKSENLRLGSDAHADEEMQPSLWNAVPAFTSEPPEEEVVPSKIHRGADDVDASSKQVSLPSVEKLFDAGGANSSSAFVFTKFGAEVPGLITFGNSTSDAVSSVSSSVNDVRVSSVASAVKPVEPLKLSPLPTASIRPSTRKQKDPALTFQFPSKVGECELRILSQPEEQHRARYLTEGSRGAVKDRSQQGYPVIKLLGYNEPAVLQVFIGSETGRVKPHGFYQACKVCGKNSTQCSEREIDGTNVIEIEISPVNDMQVTMDCVGILKLRNADVEKRIGPTKAKAKKKNSTKARLVFRTSLRKPDGTYFTLQVTSTPILCTQPIGQPEISRMSLSELCVNQTSDLFIIGKNFLKGTQIMFQEVGVDENDIKWQSEAEIEVEYFQQTHLICQIPEYPRKDLDQPVHCQIVALSGGKVSDPQDFTYKPAMMMIKEENAMETEPVGVGKALPFGVSPVALQLNRLVERTQQITSSSAMFQLPPGTIPSIGNSSVLAAPSKVVPSTHTQPVLKPATLSLPGSGQTLTLGTQGGAGDGKGAVPVQFVLPPHAVGSAVTLDSRKLGGQQPQFVLMPNSGVAFPGGGTLNNNKVPQSVFTLNSLPSNTNGQPTSLPGVGGVSPSVPNQGPATSTSPMIVILTGPPGTPTSAPAVVSNIVNNNNNINNNHSNIGVPPSAHQPVTSGQVSEPKP